MFNRRHYAMPLPSFQWTRPPTWHPFHQMNSSLTKYWVAGIGNLIFPTEVRRHTHTPGQLLTSRCITIHPPGIASASFIEDMTDPKPFCCKECGLGFSQKCHLTRHMHIHAKETFVCDVCTKPFSRRGKLNCHIFHKHQTIVDKGHGYPCPQCRKIFSRKFNLARHKLLHTSIEKTNTGKAVLDEMKCNARLYKEQLQLGKDVANNLQEYDDIPELSLSTTHKQALELYKQSRLQHPHHYENVTLRPWQLKVISFIDAPGLRQVIWIVGERGNEGKTFLQNYISYYYGSRRVVATDIAGRKKNIAHYLTKLPLECKDIFLFNHPASASEAVAYDLLEDIKDGRTRSDKYSTAQVTFKTPNTVMVFSNEYPRTEALKKDRWRIYEIRGEVLYDKSSSFAKCRLPTASHSKFFRN